MEDKTKIAEGVDNPDQAWPWCDHCQSYHHPQKPNLPKGEDGNKWIETSGSVLCLSKLKSGVNSESGLMAKSCPGMSGASRARTGKRAMAGLGIWESESWLDEGQGIRYGPQ